MGHRGEGRGGGVHKLRTKGTRGDVPNQRETEEEGVPNLREAERQGETSPTRGKREGRGLCPQPLGGEETPGRGPQPGGNESRGGGVRNLWEERPRPWGGGGGDVRRRLTALVRWATDSTQQQDSAEDGHGAPSRGGPDAKLPARRPQLKRPPAAGSQNPSPRRPTSAFSASRGESGAGKGPGW